VSFWRRLFKREGSPPTGARPLSRKEQYQRKMQLYAEIMAATNAALEIMAQMQTRLQTQDYFSPAYVQLNCALVLDHTRRVAQLLKQFTTVRGGDLTEALARIAAHLNEGLALGLKSESATLAPPMERQTLARPELLASGVAYPSKDAEAAGCLTIKAVWGWWPAVQNGTVRARRFRVAGDQVNEFTSPETGPQEQWLTYHPEQGFIMEPLPRHCQDQPFLEPGEAHKIAEYYRLLNTYCPHLQEVEWALTPEREVIILRGLCRQSPSFQESPGHQRPEGTLFSQGLTIYPGVAAGSAFYIDVDRLPDNLAIPPGTVLFANKPALSLAPRLPNLAALVVETGEPHNHLAFWAREQRLPTIFALGADTSQIPPGLMVSVDAQRLQVSAGPLEIPTGAPPERSDHPFLGEKLLQQLSPWLFSLHVNRSGQGLTPEACQSVHDLLYCASAARRQEMFCLSLEAEVSPKEAVNLVTGRLVPILVIDAGGGLSVEGPRASCEEVTSVPFQAFLHGMMSIPWPKGRPLDIKGFISVIGVTSTTPHAEDQLRRISFALLSENYMNFSLCLGYHASTIEAFIGPNLDNNYIRFHYQGGAASLDRRLRRLQLIGDILVQLGFTVTVQGDLLDAMLAGETEPTLLKKLEILGRLEVYTKQMDMVMADDGVVSSHVTEFLEKHCEAHQIMH
jgi:pyruvate, water dikinase